MGSIPHNTWGKGAKEGVTYTPMIYYCPDQRGPRSLDEREDPPLYTHDRTVRPLRGLLEKHLGGASGAQPRPPCPGGMAKSGQRAVQSLPRRHPSRMGRGRGEGHGQDGGLGGPGPRRDRSLLVEVPKGPLKGMMREMHKGERDFPEWLVRGRTIMIPKSGCTGEPHQFR